MNSGIRTRKPVVFSFAFSLIELLSVVTIIGIVAALLITVLSSAKKKGAGAACLNNVRQLNVGLSDFVQEHHDFPLDGTFSKGFFIWQRAISIKLYGDERGEDQWPRNEGVWNCPAEKSPAYRQNSGSFFDYGYNSFGVGNETNSFGLSGENSSDFKPISEGEIVSPASLIVLGDGFWGGKGGVGDGTPRLQRLSSAGVSDDQMRRVRARHNSRAVMGFADGHAESLSLKTLFEEDTYTALSRWNRDNKPHRESLR